MSKRSNDREERLSLSGKTLIKDIKRDLLKFIPLVRRRTRRNTNDFWTPEKGNTLPDYGKTIDPKNPTKLRSRKSSERLLQSVWESNTQLSLTKSAERTTIKAKRLDKEMKNYNPKKLVYPSVRRLKTWMSKSVCEEPSENKQLKKILFDHINKNMKHMNLKVSQEIEMPSVTKLSTQAYPMKLPQIQKLGSEYQK